MDFIHITVIDIIDIVLVALIMYYLYKLLGNTRASNIITGIILIYALWILVRALNMELLSTIIGSVTSVGLIALIIIFQPEIRHFLDVLGDKWITENKFIRRFFPARNKVENSDSCLDQIVLACKEMSAQRTGALIVIKRKNTLTEIENTGVIIDAKVTAPLLMNIFFKNSPLHDGAVIIGDERIVAAKCILPSTQSDVPFNFGMRHRAAVGMSEASDAVIVVVSEETGGISVVKNGLAKSNLTPQLLTEELKALL